MKLQLIRQLISSSLKSGVLTGPPLPAAPLAEEERRI